MDNVRRANPSWLAVLGIATIPLWVFGGIYAVMAEPVQTLALAGCGLAGFYLGRLRG